MELECDKNHEGGTQLPGFRKHSFEVWGSKLT